MTGGVIHDCSENESRAITTKGRVPSHGEREEMVLPTDCRVCLAKLCSEYAGTRRRIECKANVKFAGEQTSAELLGVVRLDLQRYLGAWLDEIAFCVRVNTAFMCSVSRP